VVRHNLTGGHFAHPVEPVAAHNGFGANMGEVIRFISKSERERARLIGKARATYESIFPPVDPISDEGDKARVDHKVSGANAVRSEGELVS
jgi:hypothetical protein